MNNINNDLEYEVWTEIDGYNGDYQVSNLGRVKSLKFGRKRILKPCKDKDGYEKITLSSKGFKYYYRIHVLIFESFHNYKLKKDECIHHRDFTKDNYLTNLKLMTKKDHHKLHDHKKNISFKNRKHSDVTKLNMSKRKMKISEKRIIQIHMIHKLGFSAKDIAEIFEINVKNVSRYLNGARCNHIWKIFNKEDYK